MIATDWRRKPEPSEVKCAKIPPLPTRAVSGSQSAGHVARADCWGRSSVSASSMHNRKGEAASTWVDSEETTVGALASSRFRRGWIQDCRMTVVGRELVPSPPQQKNPSLMKTREVNRPLPSKARVCGRWIHLPMFPPGATSECATPSELCPQQKGLANPNPNPNPNLAPSCNRKGPLT